jgi:uncharacterized damage-inducible protein DinB
MTPEQAITLRDYFLGELEGEAKTTRRVLEAVPSKGGDYRPDPKSRTGLELAWHIAASSDWFLEGILKATFNPETDRSAKLPPEIKSGADAAAYYEKNYIPKIAQLRNLSGEQLAKVTEFFGIFHLPLVNYLGWLTNHEIHHRGQLCAYLRAMGAKVPNIYGGSADEPFEMATNA